MNRVAQRRQKRTLRRAEPVAKVRAFTGTQSENEASSAELRERRRGASDLHGMASIGVDDAQAQCDALCLCRDMGERDKRIAKEALIRCVGHVEAPRFRACNELRELPQLDGRR